MYMKIARWCYERRWLVVIAWIVAFVGIGATSGIVGTGFSTEFEAPESESVEGFTILEEEFQGLSGQGASFLSGRIVVKADAGVDTPDVRSAIDELVDLASSNEDLQVVGPFDDRSGGRQISEDRTVAYATMDGNEEAIPVEKSAQIGEQLLERGKQLEAEIEGLQVEIGGQAFAEFQVPESEVVGVAFAIVILIVAFGSVLAMGLPLSVAFAGVGIGASLAGIASNFIKMPEFAQIIGVMIGLGVGIDYALFVVTRYREGLHDGYDPRSATVAAGDTATRAVVFAGVTVVISLLGLLLIGLEFVAGLGIAAALTVSVTILASVTLLPALLGFAKLRIELTRWRGLIAAGLVAVALLGIGFKVPAIPVVALPAALLVLVAGLVVPALKREVPKRERKPVTESIWYRWSHLIQARPWPFLIGGTLMLLFLATPLLGLRLAFPDEGNSGADTTTRKAYDLVAEAFGEGFNGPFLAVARLDSADDLAVMNELADVIAQTDGVADVTSAFPNDLEKPTAALINVTPDTSPQDVETENLVKHLRSDVVPSVVGDADVKVRFTGTVPASIDFGSYLGGRSLVFFGVVLVVSFFLLMAVFRSLLVPLKAVIMNMLSIAGAYGVVVALFQWGHLSSITGLSPGPIEPFVPMMLFAIVFGLSMDYEVFLLSRVKEEYERTGDPTNSVADGLASTARVISAAAAIMVVVFGSFILEDERTSKVFGVGLAVAVLLDATLVRMLLVPATMELLGTRNWWLPAWLDRILPALHVEGAPDHDEQMVALRAEAEADEVLALAQAFVDGPGLEPLRDPTDWSRTSGS